MIWLYIILSLIGGVLVFIIILIQWGNISHKKLLRDDPTTYCMRLADNLKRATPKLKVKYLQELFELAAHGTKQAIVELWRLLDNYDYSNIHPDINTLLYGLGSSAVEAHTSTYYIDEKGVFYMAGENSVEMVYIRAGKTGLEYAEYLFYRNDIKEFNRNAHLQLLNVIARLGSLENALKLLKEFDPYGNNYYWTYGKSTIQQIAERHPLPVKEQLLFDYITALENFRGSKGSGYRHSQTFGGTHEEIDRRIQEELNKTMNIQESIDACYKKAEGMISAKGNQAVDYFREKMAKYLDYK